MLNLAREIEISEVKSGKRIFSESNRAFIRGFIEDDIEFHHKFYGEIFYKTRVAIKRDSGVFDYIPIVISEREIDVNKLSKGVAVEIAGQFRSYAYTHNEKNRLELFLFVKSVKILDNGGFVFKNIIFLDGYICKQPFFRETSSSSRKITDLLVAVNREYNKSDYIPAIAWGRNAYFASEFEISNRIQLLGRIQSRIYRINQEEREVYEISITNLEKI